MGIKSNPGLEKTYPQAVERAIVDNVENSFIFPIKMGKGAYMLAICKKVCENKRVVI